MCTLCSYITVQAIMEGTVVGLSLRVAVRCSKRTNLSGGNSEGVETKDNNVKPLCSEDDTQSGDVCVFGWKIYFRRTCLEIILHNKKKPLNWDWSP